jgi:transcriptional regulator with XRE-family HTH domain
MLGVDLKVWRKRHGYSQDTLMQELGIKSRQTISTWENSDNQLPRMLELALKALESIPGSREIHGKPASTSDRRKMKKETI